MDYGIMDIGTWIYDNEDTIYRMLIYKKVWTPYELDKKFSDESEYEGGGYYEYCRIKNGILIPNDVLLECQMIGRDYHSTLGKYVYDVSPIYKYVRLSEIRLSRLDDCSTGEIGEKDATEINPGTCEEI